MNLLFYRLIILLVYFFRSKKSVEESDQHMKDIQVVLEV